MHGAWCPYIGGVIVIRQDAAESGPSPRRMEQLLGRLLVGLSCLALFHAAFSTYEYLSILKALAKAETALPTSIIFEALIALVLFIPGVTLSSSDLKDITYRGELATRTADDSDAKMGFMIPQVVSKDELRG